MESKLARVCWSRGKYSDVLRSAVIDPSPIKSGQKVKVIWGKTRKEYSAIISCYPLSKETAPAAQDVFPPSKSKAKRKLVRNLI